MPILRAPGRPLRRERFLLSRLRTDGSQDTVRFGFREDPAAGGNPDACRDSTRPGGSRRHFGERTSDVGTRREGRTPVSGGAVHHARSRAHRGRVGVPIHGPASRGTRREDAGMADEPARSGGHTAGAPGLDWRRERFPHFETSSRAPARTVGGADSRSRGERACGLGGDPEPCAAQPRQRSSGTAIPERIRHRRPGVRGGAELTGVARHVVGRLDLERRAAVGRVGGRRARGSAVAVDQRPSRDEPAPCGQRSGGIPGSQSPDTRNNRVRPALSPRPHQHPRADRDIGEVAGSAPHECQNRSVQRRVQPLAPRAVVVGPSRRRAGSRARGARRGRVLGMASRRWARDQLRNELARRVLTTHRANRWYATAPFYSRTGFPANKSWS